MALISTHMTGRIQLITLNRPEKRNALSYELVSELKTAFRTAQDDASTKVIILQAEGKVFSAGADLAYIEQLQKNTYEENLEDSNHLRELFEMIYRHPKPVIAKVQGHAIAGGCGLAAICDFVITVPEAKFGYTEVRIGFIPALVSIFLIRKIGESKARELLLTGDLYSAEDVASIRLVNRVVPPEELDQAVADLAEKLITQNSGQSMALTKQLLSDLPELTLDQALTKAAELNAEARGSEDCMKGIGAFLNKERIEW
ncbi:MAG: enoyl-CoA hydratase-related protein [Cyclobacteriaceae bacterium]